MELLPPVCYGSAPAPQPRADYPPPIFAPSISRKNQLALFSIDSPALTSLRGFGAKDAVHQLRESDGRKRRVLVTCRSDNPRDQLLNRLAAPLGGDHQAGVENQSHAGGSSGSRWLSIAASTSLAKSASMTAVESSGKSAMHSEIVRRGGAGAWITATGSLPLSITTSAPARTRASTSAKLLAASP